MRVALIRCAHMLVMIIMFILHMKQVKSVVLPDGTLGRSSEQLFPYGIYTIPEISMVGKTEAQLTAEGVSYEIGVADYQVQVLLLPFVIHDTFTASTVIRW
jgi:Pyridine nucleotide-disulphide oxidoreductase, dimerisation domain